MKKYLILISILIVFGGVSYWEIGNKDSARKVSNSSTDFKSISYEIDGKDIALVNGQAESEIAPGTASRLVTRYFGNDAEGDLNGDGLPDKAFLLTQSGGGSGEFFYLAVALRSGSGDYKGTNAILLGDRIAPQTTEISNGEVVVNFAERKAGEPMTTQPSMGISKFFKVTDGRLVEVGHLTN